MDFLPQKYVRVSYVTIVEKGKPDSELYWMDVSTKSIDGHEVSVDDRLPVTRFSFISNHCKIEEESAFSYIVGDTLYLFDSDDTTVAYALKCLKSANYSLDDERASRWVEIIRSII